MRLLNKKQPSRIVEIKRSVRLTPNMQRVTFTGDDLVGFPKDRNGANLKLLLPKPGASRVQFREALKSGERPITRTYTVRDYRTDANELDIDFVVHGDNGPASRFAMNCQPGDFIGIAGPGPVKLNRLDADWFVFCADMSALPAAAASMENLPATAKGVAIFEIMDVEDDKYPIKMPPEFSVTWLTNPTSHIANTQQLEQLKTINWPTGSLSVFAAGEHSSTMAIRDFLLKDQKIPRKDAYIAGYWKIGLVEDQHQIEKRKDQ